jgi:iron complex outermembrane recepter protein
MSAKQCLASVRFGWMLVLSGSLISALTLPSWAQEQSFEFSGFDVSAQPNGLSSQLEDPTQNSKLKTQNSTPKTQNSTTQISSIRDFNRPATTIKEWIAQVEAATTQVTGVSLNSTETGLEIVLETAEGKLLQIDATKFRSEGNSLIADIPNAALALPDAEEFSADNPTEEIANVRVTQLNASSIQISVTGNDALPSEEVTLRTGELAYSLNSEAEIPDEEIVVTGGEQGGYRVPNATTGTRLNIPLLETPASISVITNELIEDTAARRVEDLLPYTSGVSPGVTGDTQGGTTPEITIRGFSVFRQVYVNGLRDNSRFLVRDLANIDRVEILKGFSSLLYGTGTPGGVVNYITKKPQATPQYSVSFDAGSFDFYRGEVDLTGPLTDDKNLLYRLVLAAQASDSFVRNVEDNRIFVAPSLTLLTGGGGSLTIEGEYYRLDKDVSSGAKFFNGELFFDRSYTDPRNSNINNHYRIAAYFDQPISKQWSLNFSGQYFYTKRDLDPLVTAITFSGNRLQRFYRVVLDDYYQYNLRGEVRGNFRIGASEHQLLAGIEYNKLDSDITGRAGAFFGSIDVDDPSFDVSLPTTNRASQSNSNSDWGIYIQDFIKLGRFRLLAGLRYGEFEGSFNDETNQNDNFVSPSLGLIYSLTDSATVYASFSQSTEPQTGQIRNGGFIEPREATQYEIGAKANFLNDRLSITTALFDLTQTNIGEADPVDSDFVIPVGDVRTRGLELDVAGKITDNFSLIAAYTHFFEAEIISNNSGLEGNRLANAPRNSFGIYGKYDFTEGALRGLSLGAGLIYVDERAGDNANTFEAPDYIRVDLGAAYKVNNLTFRVAIENLFNEKYVVGSTNRANITQGTPFAVTGSVKVEF